MSNYNKLSTDISTGETGTDESRSADINTSVTRADESPSADIDASLFRADESLSTDIDVVTTRTDESSTDIDTNVTKADGSSTIINTSATRADESSANIDIGGTKAEKLSSNIDTGIIQADDVEKVQEKKNINTKVATDETAAEHGHYNQVETTHGGQLKDSNCLKTKRPRKTCCQMCHRRVGLTSVKCRCGNIYCPLHRYHNEHGCTFDYKALGRQEMRKAYPRVVAEKIAKI